MAHRVLRVVPIHVWKTTTRPVWLRPASAAQPADWPRLAAAPGSLRHDLALRAASEQPAGRRLSHIVVGIGATLFPVIFGPYFADVAVTSGNYISAFLVSFLLAVTIGALVSIQEALEDPFDGDAPLDAPQVS